MKPETKIKKVDRTDIGVDNSYYIITNYDELVDDEDTTHYIAKNTERPCLEYDAEIQAKKEAIQDEIDRLKNNEEIKKQIKDKEAELENLVEYKE